MSFQSSTIPFSLINVCKQIIRTAFCKVNDIIQFIHEHTGNDALIPQIPRHHCRTEPRLFHKRGGQQRRHMQADYDARNLPNIIPKVVIAAHSADGCFTDSRPQGQLLLRSAAVMNQLHKGSRRAARKGFEILRIFLIQCFFTQILIQIQGANIIITQPSMHS